MAQYNRANVTHFLDEVRQLDDEMVCMLWSMFVGHLPGAVCATSEDVLTRYRALPVWEQQGVLYGLVEDMTRISKALAHEAAKRARVEDPL